MPTGQGGGDIRPSPRLAVAGGEAVPEIVAPVINTASFAATLTEGLSACKGSLPGVCGVAACRDANPGEAKMVRAGEAIRTPVAAPVAPTPTPALWCWVTCTCRVKTATRLWASRTSACTSARLDSRVACCCPRPDTFSSKSSKRETLNRRSDSSAGGKQLASASEWRPAGRVGVGVAATRAATGLDLEGLDVVKPSAGNGGDALEGAGVATNARSSISRSCALSHKTSTSPGESNSGVCMLASVIVIKLLAVRALRRAPLSNRDFWLGVP